jgi:hypothetical protein
MKPSFYRSTKTITKKYTNANRCEYAPVSLMISYIAFDMYIAMNIHNDLLLTQKLLYDKLGHSYVSPELELESTEYAACDFELNALSVKFRVAKITPTKVGQFVTLWKRNSKGVIEPFCDSDPIDLVVISTRSQNHFGQFVFPKNILCKRGILSVAGVEGKRGFRVYPPWDKTTSKQASATQKWQLEYFLEIPLDGSMDIKKAKSFY